MKLVSLYSEPSNLFKKVIFHSGINIIYGKKDNEGDPKKSLNGIGKSTLLDLIDFCLLSSSNSNHSKRLNAAKSILSQHEIVLEIEHEEELFYLKRSIDNPKHIKFGTKEKILTYNLEDLQKILANKFFYQRNYNGEFHEAWFRNLVLFFLKIQKPRQEKFLDPIKYIPECSEAELMPIHFFLLDIPNSLSYQTLILSKTMKLKKDAQREIKKILSEDYAIKNPEESSSELIKLNNDINKLQQSIEAFKLLKNYNDAESSADNLTLQIKELFSENFNDRQTISAYKDTIQLKDHIDVRKIGILYTQLNETLGKKIKETLENAIKFRRDLSKSRQDFLEKEIKKLSTGILERTEKIEQLENERAKLYKFLANKDAWKDLSEAYSVLNSKQNRKSELSSQLGLYDNLTLKIAELERDSKSIDYNIQLLLTDLKSKKFPRIASKFLEIYNAIYSDRQDESLFDLKANPKKNAKVELVVKFPDMSSKGKNQGRTLIYDLLVVINAIENGRNLPSFLVHDGIFDGMDKAHFLALFLFIEKLTQTKKIDFQYIITLNEEGTLTEKFGANDMVNNKTIEQKAIITLTPKNKLFGQDFSE